MSSLPSSAIALTPIWVPSSVHSGAVPSSSVHVSPSVEYEAVSSDSPSLARRMNMWFGQVPGSLMLSTWVSRAPAVSVQYSMNRPPSGFLVNANFV